VVRQTAGQIGQQQTTSVSDQPRPQS